jgi:hypothetical protein
MANQIVKGKLKIEELFGMDGKNYLTDEEVRAAISKTKSGREIFDEKVRSNWRTWIFGSLNVTDAPPFRIEQEATGDYKTFLESPFRKRVFIHKSPNQHSLAISINYGSLNDRPNIGTILKTVRRLIVRESDNIDISALMKAFWEILTDRKIRYGTDDMCQRLGEICASDKIILEQLRSAANQARIPPQNKNNPASEATTRFDLQMSIGGRNYAMRNAADMYFNMIHAALTGGDEVRKQLNWNMEQASYGLWHQLINYQPIYFSKTPKKKILDLLNMTKKRLAEEAVSGGEMATSDLEYYAYLESLLTPSQSTIFRYSLPNLMIERPDGRIENEYDTATILLTNNGKVEVWFWACTTERKIAAKRKEDSAKIQALKDAIGDRWGGEVRMVTNYIHVDRGAIKREIDGQQTIDQIA